ncbi:MAG: VOC family protein [Pseudomonadota bacterium]
MLALDHLVICTEDLETGAQEVSEKLGAPLKDGGRHAVFGTHSKLLSLGSDTYLKIIAKDPGSAAPRRARWFGLDDFAGPMRVANWVVRSNELSHLISLGAAGPGSPMASSRDGLRWTMVVPDDGRPELDGIAPTLIEWRGGTHPCQSLPDQNVRLTTLKLQHPDVTTSYLPDDPRVETQKGPHLISATFETTSGPVSL